MRLSIGAILIVTVPETIIRSAWRGEAEGTMPTRSTSTREEEQHRAECGPPEGAQDERPWKEEHGQGIEHDEEQGHQVKAHGELEPGRPDRRRPALVVLQLDGVGAGRAEEPGDAEAHHP